MKIAIMGSGGVGGYFGARLAQGGAEVAFIARGAHLAAMRADGLRIEGPAPLHLPVVRATDDPASIGPVDLVLFGVKLWDTEAALQQIRPLVGPHTAILSLQNGVQKDDFLRAAYPAGQIMGGVCYIASTVARPGVIQQTGPMQRLVFGEFGGARSSRAEAFLIACQQGGITAELSGDIARAIWEKFVFLVGLSATTATMRSPIGPIRENPETRAFLLDLMREVVAVGRAEGVALPEDYAEQRLALTDGVPYGMESSMSHDLQRGNRLEVRFLSGAVMALAAKHGIAAPLNRAATAILALYADGRVSRAAG